jgi:hypothetical protein
MCQRAYLAHIFGDIVPLVFTAQIDLLLKISMYKIVCELLPEDNCHIL